MLSIVTGDKHPGKNHLAFRLQTKMLFMLNYVCYLFTGQSPMSEPGLCNLHGGLCIEWPVMEYGYIDGGRVGLGKLPL